MESQTKIGNRIFALRKSLGLSKAEFAKGVGVSKEKIIDVEKHGNVSADLLKRICLTYEASPTYLMKGIVHQTSGFNEAPYLNKADQVNAELESLNLNA